LEIKLSETGNGPIFVNEAKQELPLAEVPPMPENIKDINNVVLRFALSNEICIVLYVIPKEWILVEFFSI
jgi:hypothetical protein